MELYIKKLRLMKETDLEFKNQYESELFDDEMSLYKNKNDGNGDFIHTLFETSIVHFLKLYPR